ncbi:hypothetical protein [Streptosporangium sp. NPDC020145]|uniref:hypothetical protein n=1 Tax=Streptosporangium sp. NPDC020145 TaxID=3154694 RepID=UPI00342E3CBA
MVRLKWPAPVIMDVVIWGLLVGQVLLGALNAFITTSILVTMGMPLAMLPLLLVAFYLPVLILGSIPVMGPTRRRWAPIVTVLLEAGWLVWTNFIAIVHYIEWADTIIAVTVIFLIGVERLREVRD